MERDELVGKLTQLHADLAKTNQVDPATLERLSDLTADIDRLLDENDPEVTPDDAEPITSGLKNLLLKFEAEHPQFSVAVGKVADACWRGLGFKLHLVSKIIKAPSPCPLP